MPKFQRSGQAKTLTPAQLDELVEVAPTSAHRCLWSVMRFTGSRCTETLALRWGAVGDERITFAARTTKTRRTREVMIAPRLHRELNAFRVEWARQWGQLPGMNDLLFPGRFGMAEPMTRRAADAALRRALDSFEWGRGVSLHSFRRSMCSQMANSGVSLRVVAQFSGHRSLDALSRYLDAGTAHERAALECLG